MHILVAASALMAFVGAFLMHAKMIQVALVCALAVALLQLFYLLQSYSGNTASFLGSIVGLVIYPGVLFIFLKELGKYKKTLA